MIGRNPIWVSRQHGHSVRTMLEIYAAWAEGAVESDVDSMRRAMGFDVATVPASARGLASSHPRIREESVRGVIARPLFSIWHWIWHQKRGACT